MGLYSERRISNMIGTRSFRFLVSRFILPTFVLTLIFSYLGYYTDISQSLQQQKTGLIDTAQSLDSGREPPFSYETHPIEDLVVAADADFNSLLSKEAKTLAEAAAAYRNRRGRHPPPGFEAWYKYAKEHSSLVIEDFFDPIYDDLALFWGLDPIRMREDANCFEMRLSVRNGKVAPGSQWFWTVAWRGVIKEIEHLLPDMDIALNAMDEPRIVAPWKEVDDAQKSERASRADNLGNLKSVDAEKVVRTFERLPKEIVEGEEKRKKVGERIQWISEGSYWDHSKVGCSPQSKVGQGSPKTPAYMHRGFVSNFTKATSVCDNPRVANSTGIFTHPLSIRTTRTLFPLFGGSKLETNNEIRLPAAMYVDDHAAFTGGGEHGPEWENKTNKAIWRGTASGGHAGADMWKGMQRHRFVRLNNATAITGQQRPDHLAAVGDGQFQAWSDRVSDVRFVELNCGDQCESARENFKAAEKVPLADQFACKILPDIDGNSFSGRYRGFLLSTSLPVKATIWKEWHDSRLVAWKHFVPMSYWFEEWWDIIEYFLGYKTKDGIQVGGNDDLARTIATDGKEWAEKVLRRDDMVVYTLRLLLEYARVTDPNRTKMGWVDDITGE